MVELTRRQRRDIDAQNKEQPTVLTPVARETWPLNPPAGLVEVWRSKTFLVQIFDEPDGVKRLSVIRPEPLGRTWGGGISWEELQNVKREVGFANFDAVEIYPADRDIVNLTNMRHLWVFPGPFSLAWRNTKDEERLWDGNRIGASAYTAMWPASLRGPACISGRESDLDQRQGGDGHRRGD